MNQQLISRMKTSLLVIFVLALFASTIAVSAEGTQLINVSGTGSVSLQPDIVKISIGFDTQNEDVQEAINENTQKVESVKTALFAEGLTDGDIKTTGYSLYSSPKYYRDTTAAPDEYIYTVNYYLEITLNDLSKLNLILDTAVNNGANNISGITYDSTERTTAYDEARDLAIDDGYAKAEKIAEKLGVTLGNVDSISVSDDYAYYDYGMRGMGYGGGGEAATPTMNPGLVDVTVSVSLAYRFDL